MTTDTRTDTRTDALEAVLDAARAMLAMIDHLTTDEFRRGCDRAARERLRAAIREADLPRDPEAAP